MSDELRTALESAIDILDSIEDPAWSGFGGEAAIRPLRAALARHADDQLPVTEEWLAERWVRNPRNIGDGSGRSVRADRNDTGGRRLQGPDASVQNASVSPNVPRRNAVVLGRASVRQRDSVAVAGRSSQRSPSAVGPGRRCQTRIAGVLAVTLALEVIDEINARLDRIEDMLMTTMPAEDRGFRVGQRVGFSALARRTDLKPKMLAKLGKVTSVDAYWIMVLLDGRTTATIYHHKFFDIASSKKR